MAARAPVKSVVFKEALYAPLRLMQLTLDLDRVGAGSAVNTDLTLPDPPAVLDTLARRIEACSDTSLERDILNKAAAAAAAESARTAAAAKRHRAGPSPASAAAAAAGASHRSFDEDESVTSELPSATRRLSLGVTGGGVASPAPAPAVSEPLPPASSAQPWSCAACTLVNPPEEESCQACGGEKPAGSAGGSDSDAASGPGRPTDRMQSQPGPAAAAAAAPSPASWHCDMCAAENGASSSACHMCSYEPRSR